MPEEKRLHYITIYFQRLLSSTRGWKDDEFGAYVRLLLEQAENGHIPDDPDELGRLITTYKKNWPRLSKKFKSAETPGHLKNVFMNEVREKALNKSVRNSKNGVLGAEAKKQRTLSDRSTNADDSLKRNGNNAHTGLLVNGSLGLKEEGTGETNQGMERQPIIQGMKQFWMQIKPDYPYSEIEDGHALFEIGEFIAQRVKTCWPTQDYFGYDTMMQSWQPLAHWISSDDFYKSFSLGSICKIKTLQTIWQKSKEVKNGTVKPGTPTNRKSAGANEVADRLTAKLAARGKGDPGSQVPGQEVS